MEDSAPSLKPQPASNLFITEQPALAPLLQQVACLLGPVANHESELFSEERPAIERAVQKRRNEFSSGRHFAHLLLDSLALPRQAIPQGRRRAPAWPGGVLGSISHSNTLAWVALTHAGRDIRGLGIDVEARQRLPAELHERLFTAAETAAIDERGTDFATWLFTAKESIYKATEPLAGAFIGFAEAECRFDAGGRVFTVSYLGDHAPSSVMERGIGVVKQDNEHVYALFVIPD
ncbi:MAG: 4'-phosphopantetheinyl transferase superfamily protein [Pseudomonadota bacterium]